MKVIATDLDGTIVGQDKTVSERTIRALEECAVAGDVVVFLTGRAPHDPMAGLPTHVLRDGRMFCANGAVEYDVVRDRVLDAATIPAPQLIRAIRVIRQAYPGGRFCIDGLARTVYERGYPWAPEDPGKRGLFDDIADAVTEDLGAYKTVYLHEGASPEDMVRAVAPQLAGTVGLTYGSTRNPFFLEMVPRGVSKGTALASYARSLGVERDDVIAFGDMPNDVGMFDAAGTSYAVGDAPAEVIAAATHRAARVEDDGVAAVLESLVRA